LPFEVGNPSNTSALLAAAQFIQPIRPSATPAACRFLADRGPYPAWAPPK